MQNWDYHLFLDVNGFARHTGWLHAPMLEYARYGVVLFAALIAVGFVVARHGPSRRLAAAGWTGIATLLAEALNQPLGRLFAEARPYATHPSVLWLGDRTKDFSFPSDHAVMAGAVTAGLLLVSRRLGLVSAAAAVVMAFARVYIGAHYPWDVAAGLLVGATVTLLGWALLRLPLTALASFVRRLPLVEKIFAPGGDLASKRGRDDSGRRVTGNLTSLP